MPSLKPTGSVWSSLGFFLHASHSSLEILWLEMMTGWSPAAGASNRMHFESTFSTTAVVVVVIVELLDERAIRFRLNV